MDRGNKQGDISDNSSGKVPHPEGSGVFALGPEGWEETDM